MEIIKLEKEHEITMNRTFKLINTICTRIFIKLPGFEEDLSFVIPFEAIYSKLFVILPSFLWLK